MSAAKQADKNIDVVKLVLDKIKKRKQLKSNEIDEAIIAHGQNLGNVELYRGMSETCTCKYGRQEGSGPQLPKDKAPGGGDPKTSTSDIDKLKDENERLKKMLRDMEANLTSLKDGASNKQAFDKCRENNEDLRKQLKELKESKDRQIEELRMRLSTIAGEKISDNNPDITDLSDPFRPTKLAEKFRQVYDDEWTHAYEDLDNMKMKEPDMINFLANVVVAAAEVCKQVQTDTTGRMTQYILDDFENPRVKAPVGQCYLMSKQKPNMHRENVASKYIKEMTKGLAPCSVPGLAQIFKEYYLKHLMTQHKIGSATKHIATYVDKVVEYVWLMTVQDPPMALLWQKQGDRYDKDKFSFYTQRGPIVSHSVWPAVLLHKDGPPVSKGIVQAK